MEREYSVEFFTSLIERLQEACQNNIEFSQSVEISGYISVEIDNVKKERYVLSELLQSSGNVVSESFCVKVLKNSKSVSTNYQVNPIRTRTGKENVKCSSQRRPQTSTRTRSYDETFTNEDCDDLSSSASARKSSRRTYGSHYLAQEVSASMPSDVDRYPGPLSRDVSESGPTPLYDYQCPAVVQPESPPQKHEVIDLDLFEEEEEEEYPNYLALDDGHGQTVGLDDGQGQTVALDDGQGQTMALDDGQGQTVALDDGQGQTMALDDGQDQTVDEIQGQLDPDPNSSTTRSLPTSSLPVYQHRQPSPGSLVAVQNGIKRFIKFVCEKYNEDIDLLETSPEVLNEYMLCFFREVKKKDGSEMSGVSLRNTLSYLIKYMKDNAYPYSLVRDEVFQPVRDYIKQKIEASEKSMTAVISRLTDQDVEILFQTQQLSSLSPDTLINSMWFLNTHFFNIKGPAEHFNLTWGNLVLELDSDGEEHLVRILDVTAAMPNVMKVRANRDSLHGRFVELYKHYRAARPQSLLQDNSAFYLKPVRNPMATFWFVPERLSWNAITTLWRKMLTASGLPLNKRIR